jgi:hypothetical protein
MAKLTPEERAELEAKLAEDEDEDFDFDYTEDNRSIRLPWSKRDTLHEFGFKGRPKVVSVPDKDKKTQARQSSVFGQRRTS